MTADCSARISPLGDSAILISWPELDPDDAAQLVQQLWHSLLRNDRDGTGFRYEGIVPGYCTLTLHYDPARWNWSEVSRLPVRLPDSGSATNDVLSERQRIEIPVCYDGDFAIDLPRVAEFSGLSPDEIIDRHLSAEYRVRMIGFSPGFPYLSGLPSQLATPRHSAPRLTVPAGAVAIGGQQAGIYPRESPGGWNLIGRTPVSLFQPMEDPPCLLLPGDSVRFHRISAQEFLDLLAASSFVGLAE